MKPDIVKKGAIYDVDSRKGRLTIKLLEDVDIKQDTFFQAEIIQGRAKFASMDNQAAQRADGLGTEGTVLSFRTTLCHLIRRRPDLEKKVTSASERTGKQE